jgi:hypothetical protein
MSSLLKRWSESLPKPLISPIVRDQRIQLEDGKDIHVYRRRDQNISDVVVEKREPVSVAYQQLRFRGIHVSPPIDLADNDFYYDKTTKKIVYKFGELIIIAKS